jgi:hypothetical protein
MEREREFVRETMVQGFKYCWTRLAGHFLGPLNIVQDCWSLSRRIFFIFKARRLFHIDFFFDRSIQEGTLDVHLIKLETMVSSIGK